MNLQITDREGNIDIHSILSNYASLSVCRDRNMKKHTTTEQKLREIQKVVIDAQKKIAKLLNIVKKG